MDLKLRNYIKTFLSSTIRAKKQIVFIFLVLGYCFSWSIFISHPHVLLNRDMIPVKYLLVQGGFLTFWFGILLVFYKFYGFQYITKKIFFLSVVAIALPPLIIFPLSSTDLFSYITRGRLVGVYGLNPYITTYSEVYDGEFSIFRNVWSSSTTAYAPLYVFLTGGLSIVFSQDPVLTLYLFKLFFFAVFMLSSYLLVGGSNNIKKVFLFSFNPVVLFDAVNNSHVTMFTVFLILLSLKLLKKDTYVSTLLALVALFLSFYIKYFTIIFFPFYFIYLFRSRTQKKVFWKYVFFTISFFTISAILLYIPFGGVVVFQRIFEIAGASLVTILGLGSYVLQKLYVLVLGTGRHSSLFPYAAFFAVYLKFILTFARKKAAIMSYSILVRYMALSYFSFLLISLNWVFSWYFLIPLSLSILLLVSTDGKEGMSLYLISSIIMLVGILFSPVVFSLN